MTLHKVHFGLVRSSVLKIRVESCGLAVIIYPWNRYGQVRVV